MNTALISWNTRIARAIDRLSEGTGRAVSWLVLLMVLLMVYDVGGRYLFNTGSVALQELEWHLFAALFLLGGAYTLKHDDHVRLDVIYQSRWMGPRRRAWVNLFGSLLLLMPFCALVIYSAMPFVTNAYGYNEGSPDPGGLPHRWLLKACIPLGFAMLMLQGISLALTSLNALLGPRDR
ncbi:MAG: TRAP transporter small permease subunit [Gammaproteobacteria bacterium]|nr:TRAP transporter small permease subunit [Gammaproteobacteria bacterium]